MPVALEMMCGKEAVNGSLNLGRLHLCNLLPGNTTGILKLRAVPIQFEDNYFTERRIGSEAGSYQGP